MRRRMASGALGLIGLLIALVLLVHPWPLEGGEPPRVLTGPVVHVVDGDTIDVQLDGRKAQMGYIGMNTPETNHPTQGLEPCGPEALHSDPLIT
jgi:micrococcal nuclease